MISHVRDYILQSSGQKDDWGETPRSVSVTRRNPIAITSSHLPGYLGDPPSDLSLEIIISLSGVHRESSMHIVYLVKLATNHVSAIVKLHYK
jgi:hypothetical protein